jgi:hypothetical protein
MNTTTTTTTIIERYNDIESNMRESINNQYNTLADLFDLDDDEVEKYADMAGFSVERDEIDNLSFCNKRLRGTTIPESGRSIFCKVIYVKDFFEKVHIANDYKALIRNEGYTQAQALKAMNDYTEDLKALVGGTRDELKSYVYMYSRMR